METIIPLSGIRGIIASKMQESLQSTAQLSFHTEARADRLIRYRYAQRESGVEVSYQDILLKMISVALTEHPALNGCLVDKEIRLNDQHRISVAIALESGLVAPALNDIKDQTIAQIAEQRQELTERGQKQKLTVKEMTKGTFTLSNLGHRRVDFFTPVLNIPQLAILGVGRIANKPWVDDNDNISVMPVLGLSLTVDHRAVDGDECGAFLTTLVGSIEHFSE